VRENREAVHDAWDLDRNATLTRFYQSHPEWAGSAPVGIAFDWKWYYAFQQLGDERVATMSRAYRAGVALREQRAGLVSWALPPIAIQRGLHRLANSTGRRSPPRRSTPRPSTHLATDNGDKRGARASSIFDLLIVDDECVCPLLPQPLTFELSVSSLRQGL
jgi:hypothetical protein